MPSWDLYGKTLLFFLMAQIMSPQGYFNSLPNNKFLNWSEIKVFADDTINMTEKLKFGFRRVVNIVGKGENAGYQHFLLF